MKYAHQGENAESITPRISFDQFVTLANDRKHRLRSRCRVSTQRLRSQLECETRVILLLGGLCLQDTRSSTTHEKSLEPIYSGAYFSVCDQVLNYLPNARQTYSQLRRDLLVG